MLKPQDILVLLKLVAMDRPEWTYQQLSVELAISQSEAHAAVRRAVTARLMSTAGIGRGEPIREALMEFLAHGIRYVFPAVSGPMTRGMPTGWAAQPLSDSIAGASGEPPPVWAWAEGTVRGLELKPLYPSVPAAAAKDRKLYELLALVDAIRGGRARERNLAIKELEARILVPAVAS